jgi:hypothetical protein
MRSIKIVMIDERNAERKRTVGYSNMYTVSEFLCKFVEKGRSLSW